MGDHPEVKTGSSTTKHPQNENAGPIIKETQESEEYQQDLQVVLGTAFGVIAIVGLVALTFLLYRIYKSRQAALSYTHNEILDAFERDTTVDIDGKSQPVVLLLYAYDCSVHQQVVAALAGFLMEACGVTVSVDLLEELEITDKGIDDWLVDRLQDADYIMVLCSLGARLRCSKKGVRFKPDSHQLLPDYFAVAVDYVAEKMRAEKQKGLSLNKFLTVYMDYSTRSDIPPQLEAASQFCLMKDIHKLHLYFNAQGPDTIKMDTVSQTNTCETHYHESETGAILKATIEQAKIYFRNNPSWMDDRLEPERCPGFSLRGAKNRKRRRNSMEQPLLTLTETPQIIQNIDKSLGSGENYPKKSEHEILNHGGKLSPGLEINTRISNSLSPVHCDSLINVNDQMVNYNGGIFQNRQNSLPSSLASSCLGMPTARQALSKSMDSFAMDNCGHADGLPCLFCNCIHMEARAECRISEQHRHPHRRHTSAGLLKEQSQSLLHLNHGDLCPTRSQTTVLHAEVHQEWGQSNRATPEKKSSTFAGDPRSWSSQLDFSSLVSPYQSLPPHHQPANVHDAGQILEWERGMQRWASRSEVIGLHGVNHSHPRQCQRTLSDCSMSTDDSCSISDGDSLERDLRSIHNISSFQEFINSSAFVNSVSLSKTASNFHLIDRLGMNDKLKQEHAKRLNGLIVGSNC